jgi:hypothetical protein
MTAWIQAAAAVAQVVLAFVLWRATTKYVDLTAKLLSNNQAQLKQIQEGTFAVKRARLLRTRQLVNRLRTVLMDLPERLEGSGVDRKMRTTALWTDEPKELAKLVADSLPSVQSEASDVTNNIDWLSDRVGEVRRTTPEQGFRYERIDSVEWQNRRDRVLKALSSIDGVAAVAAQETDE